MKCYDPSLKILIIHTVQSRAGVVAAAAGTAANGTAVPSSAQFCGAVAATAPSFQSAAALARAKSSTPTIGLTVEAAGNASFAAASSFSTYVKTLKSKNPTQYKITNIILTSSGSL